MGIAVICLAVKIDVVKQKFASRDAALPFHLCFAYATCVPATNIFQIPGALTRLGPLFPVYPIKIPNISIPTCQPTQFGQFPKRRRTP